MKKIKCILILIIFIGLLSCGNNNSADSLKQNENLLKETMKKCSTGEIKSNSTECVNVKKVQSDLAKEIWDKNKTEIEAKVKENEKYIENGEHQHMFDLFPEKVAAYVAKTNEITEEEFREGVISFSTENYEGAKLIMVRDFSKAKVNQTFAGRTYVIVPLSSHLEADGKKTGASKMETLIFEDEGKWYMVNIDKTSIPVLKEVYPDLKELKELQ